MVNARDNAGLVTTNMAWNMVVGILYAMRKRLTPEQVFCFADQLPPAVRGLFQEGWLLGGLVADVGTEDQLLADVRSIRTQHNFSPDNALQAV